MSARQPAAAAWWLCALALATLTGGVVLQEVTGAPSNETLVEQVGLFLASTAFPVIGALVVSREPRNALGWVFVAVGACIGVLVLSTEYAYYGLVKNDGAPGATLAAWFEQWLWFPSLGLIVTYGLLLFPTGRPPSSRWRWLAWTTGVLLAIVTMGGMLEETLESGYSVPNPIGITGLGDVEQALGPVLLLVSACAVLCVSSVIVRYRRSRGEERQQLKLVAFAAGVMIIGFFAGDLVLPDSGWLFPLMLLTFQSSIGVAILKYRLYDIDIIINRALVYATLTAFLGLCYVALIVVLQNVLTRGVKGSPLAVAISTLGVAALFRPARLRIQAAIDRRFNRRKYDAAQTIEVFSARLREEIDLDTLSTHLVDVVDVTMEPASVSLWLRSSSGREGLASEN